ncbi:MAG: hypothetical protein ACYC96_11395 [Fimbriimonadaceae bacterium]
MTPPVEAPEPPRKRGNPALVVTVVLGTLGLLCIVLIAVFAAILFPAFRHARIVAVRRTALSRMQSLAAASLLYATDNDDRLPMASTWMDSLAKYDRGRRDFYSPGVRQPNSRQPRAYGIAFMRSLSGVKLDAVQRPTERVLLFDSTLTERNASSGLETLPKPPRYGSAETGGNVLAFVDGHVELVTAADAVNLK